MKVRVYMSSFLGLLLLLGCGSAYFEHTYRCVIENKSIQVSLTTGEQLCLDYMAGLVTLVKTVNEDLKSATTNASLTTGYDRDYRLGVEKKLSDQKQSLVDLQQQIALAMKDFEQELFVRVKGIVGYYLFPQATSLTEKIGQGKKLFGRLVTAGNKEQALFVRKQIDMREREMILLERIKNATDFATLIPPLKWWVSRQEKASF